MTYDKSENRYDGSTNREFESKNLYKTNLTIRCIC